MITRELLKKEIDYVQDQYLTPLYKIIKTFEEPDATADLDGWKGFIEKFASSQADTPIKRGNQGSFEDRTELE